MSDITLKFKHSDYHVYVLDTTNVFIYGEPLGTYPGTKVSDDCSVYFEWEGSNQYADSGALVTIINDRTKHVTSMKLGYNLNMGNRVIYIDDDLPIDVGAYYNPDFETFDGLYADKSRDYTAYRLCSFNNYSQPTTQPLLSFVNGYFPGSKALRVETSPSNYMTTMSNFSGQFMASDSTAQTLEIRFKFEEFNDNALIVQCSQTMGFYSQVGIIEDDVGFRIAIFNWSSTAYYSDYITSFNVYDWHVIAITTRTYAVAGKYPTSVYIDGVCVMHNVELSVTLITYPAQLSFGGRYYGAVKPYVLLVDEVISYNAIKYTGDSYTVNNSYPLNNPPLVQVTTPVAILTATANSVISGHSVTFDASNSYIENGTITGYEWCNGTLGVTNTEVITSSGYHYVTVTADNGTQDIAYTYVQALPVPQVAPVAKIVPSSNTCICGESITLSGAESYCIDSNVTDYLWSTGETTATIEVSPEETTTYHLTVTAANGLSSQASVLIDVESGEIELMQYLPPYWWENAEMQQIQSNTLNYAVYDLNDASNIITSDAYIASASNTRLHEWEHDLAITSEGTTEERRTNILSFFKRQGKLNEYSIKDIVNNFAHGAECNVEFVNSTIRILIRPVTESETAFPRIESIMQAKKPAHLGLSIERFYCTWGEVYRDFPIWDNVRLKGTWEDVKLYLPD